MTDRSEVLAVGSAAIDHCYALSNLPGPDESAHVLASEERFGGVAANVASALVRFDRDSGVLARVGDDPAGERIARDLADREVITDRLQRGTDEHSTYCLVFRDREGRRSIVAGGESAQALRLRPADVTAIRGARAVFVDAYVPDGVTRTIVAEARKGEFVLAFDLAGPMAEFTHRGIDRGTIDDLVPIADLLVANEAAIRSYLGVEPREAAAELRERGLQRGTITLGSRGALLIDEAGTIATPAFEVEATDTTGAGDVFTAGLLHAWELGDREKAAAGRFAAAAAALSCTATGARGRLPTVEDIEAFLASR
jgi:ribokinase/sulfofructose kinase